MRKLSRAQARRLLLALGAGAGAYALYRYYYHATARRRDGSQPQAPPGTWARLQRAAKQYSEAFVSLSDVAHGVVGDLQAYLDAAQVGDAQQQPPQPLPPRLAQLLRLASSPEACEALRKLASATRDGVLPHAWNSAAATASGSGQAGPSAGAAPDSAPAAPWPERLMGTLASERGQTLVSLVVAVGSRNIVGALCDHFAPQAAVHAAQRPTAAADAAPTASTRDSTPPQARASSSSGGQAWLEQLFDVLATPNGRDVMVTALGVFTTRAVDTWLANTADMDPWDEILTAAGRPQHRATMERLTTVFTSTAVRSAMSYSSRCEGLSQQEQSMTAPHTRGSNAAARLPFIPPLCTPAAPTFRGTGDADGDLVAPTAGRDAEDASGVSGSRDAKEATEDNAAGAGAYPSGTPPLGRGVGVATTATTTSSDSESICSGGAHPRDGSVAGAGGGSSLGGGGPEPWDDADEVTHTAVADDDVEEVVGPTAAADGNAEGSLAAALEEEEEEDRWHVRMGAKHMALAGRPQGGGSGGGRSGGGGSAVESLRSAMAGGVFVSTALAETLHKAGSDPASRSLALALAGTCVWQACHALVFSLSSLVCPSRAAAAAAAMSARHGPGPGSAHSSSARAASAPPARQAMAQALARVSNSPTLAYAALAMVVLALAWVYAVFAVARWALPQNAALVGAS